MRQVWKEGLDIQKIFQIACVERGPWDHKEEHMNLHQLYRHQAEFIRRHTTTSVNQIKSNQQKGLNDLDHMMYEYNTTHRHSTRMASLEKKTGCRSSMDTCICIHCLDDYDNFTPININISYIWINLLNWY